MGCILKSQFKKTTTCHSRPFYLIERFSLKLFMFIMLTYIYKSKSLTEPLDHHFLGKVQGVSWQQKDSGKKCHKHVMPHRGILVTKPGGWFQKWGKWFEKPIMSSEKSLLKKRTASEQNEGLQVPCWGQRSLWTQLSFLTLEPEGREEEGREPQVLLPWR